MTKAEAMEKSADAWRSIASSNERSRLLIEACRNKDAAALKTVLTEDSRDDGFKEGMDIAFKNNDISCFEPLIRKHWGHILVYQNTYGKSPEIQKLVKEMMEDEANFY